MRLNRERMNVCAMKLSVRGKKAWTFGSVDTGLTCFKVDIFPLRDRLHCHISDVRIEHTELGVVDQGSHATLA